MADPALEGLLSHYRDCPIFRSCSVYPQNISSWTQGPPAILYPVCNCSFPSLATHPTLLLLLHGLPGVYKTIKVYLASICLQHLERGLEDPTKDELLHLLCTDIKRSQGVLTHTCLPITINVLQTLKSKLRHDPSFSLLEKRLLGSLYPGFLQASEFATSNLIWQHINLGGNRYTVFIGQSKTDPFRCGHTITIHATDTSTCPV